MGFWREGIDADDHRAWLSEPMTRALFKWIDAELECAKLNVLAMALRAETPELVSAEAGKHAVLSALVSSLLNVEEEK